MKSFLFVLLFLLAGCGSSNNNASVPPISSHANCTKVVQSVWSGADSLLFKYVYVKYSDGSVLVTCEVDNATGSYSSSDFWSSASSDPSLCIVDAAPDASDASGASWYFKDYAAGSPKAVFTDQFSSHNNYTVTFTTTGTTTSLPDCITD